MAILPTSANVAWRVVFAAVNDSSAAWDIASHLARHCLQLSLDRPKKRFLQSIVTSDFRLLLRQAVQRAQAPNQVSGMNANNLATRK
jgi:hypothetical protein